MDDILIALVHVPMLDFWLLMILKVALAKWLNKGHKWNSRQADRNGKKGRAIFSLKEPFSMNQKGGEMLGLKIS